MIYERMIEGVLAIGHRVFTTSPWDESPMFGRKDAAEPTGD